MNFLPFGRKSGWVCNRLPPGNKIDGITSGTAAGELGLSKSIL